MCCENVLVWHFKTCHPESFINLTAKLFFFNKNCNVYWEHIQEEIFFYHCLFLATPKKALTKLQRKPNKGRCVFNRKFLDGANVLLSFQWVSWGAIDSDFEMHRSLWRDAIHWQFEKPGGHFEMIPWTEREVFLPEWEFNMQREENIVAAYHSLLFWRNFVISNAEKCCKRQKQPQQGEN